MLNCKIKFKIFINKIIQKYIIIDLNQTIYRYEKPLKSKIYTIINLIYVELSYIFVSLTFLLQWEFHLGLRVYMFWRNFFYEKIIYKKVHSWKD